MAAVIARCVLEHLPRKQAEHLERELVTCSTNMHPLLQAWHNAFVEQLDHKYQMHVG